ncbi:MAG TPA: heparinase II/III family protein [Planctomycetota bacterium]|nr:heparinase II/III family protein [Planctomycetota bacterium]
MKNPFLYFQADDLPRLREQFRGPVFERDRARLDADLAVVRAGGLAPTLFSWWCHELRAAELAGQYQASLESLLAARHLLDDRGAPARAREILLAQAALPAWTEPKYGPAGHDLASSHHARAFAAGLEAARGALSIGELDALAVRYESLVRGPYLAACFRGNAYLLGTRNTNWLAHLSGSVLLAELSLEKTGRGDRETVALAKANVLRYIDAVAADGSLPENGDYLHYGMEFALLALGAFDLHFGTDVLGGHARSGLRRAIEWPLAFTDASGDFWADFGDAHVGRHEASRAVGYLFARHFGSAGGQWLGDLASTREPLAALLRPAGVEPAHAPPRLAHFRGQEWAVANFADRSLAIQGGPCRSDLDQIPHRHYDAGSIIYRSGGINLIADSGFDRYSASYWDDYDDPGHERSAGPLHNLVLADGRGPQKADRAGGRVLLCDEPRPGWARMVWEATPRTGLAGWERLVLLREGGPLLVVDSVKPGGAGLVSVPWHLHAAPVSLAGDRFATGLLGCRVLASLSARLSTAEGHPRPSVRIDAPGTAGPVRILSVFSSPGAEPSVDVDWEADKLSVCGVEWTLTSV